AGAPVRRSQYVLVAGEVAVAVVLLLGAGLMVTSFQEQAALDPGFAAEGVVAARFSLPASSYPEERRLALLSTLDASLRTAPGGSDVAFGSDAPLRGSASAAVLSIPGDPDTRMRFYFHRVSTGYFDLLR